MTTGSERGSVQYPFIRYAEEVGWTVVSREEALRLRGDESGIVFTDVLVDQLEALNPTVVNRDRAVDLAHRVVRALPNIKGNEDVWEYLRGLKKVFVEEEKRERDVTIPRRGSIHRTTSFMSRMSSPFDPARMSRRSGSMSLWSLTAYQLSYRGEVGDKT